MSIYPTRNPNFQRWAHPAHRHREDEQNADHKFPLHYYKTYHTAKIWTTKASRECTRINVVTSTSEEESKPAEIPLRSAFIKQRLHELSQAFVERTHQVKKRIELPPTPGSPEFEERRRHIKTVEVKDSLDDDDDDDDKPLDHRQNGIRLSEAQQILSFNTKKRLLWNQINYLFSHQTLDPQSFIYILWLFIVSAAYLHNSYTIPLRATFPYQTPSNVATWLLFDYLSDAIYVSDILIFQPRVSYLEDGFWITDYQQTRKNYRKSVGFILDAVSLIPLDLLYLIWGRNMVIFRVPRILKLHRFRQAFTELDRILPFPHAVRIVRTLFYMSYLVHINTCTYYGLSAWEGLNSDKWTFNGNGTAYVRCFYVSFKTAVGVGRNPKPQNNLEMVYMTSCWLSGVFIFAILIGQIRDIIATASKTKNEYRIIVDNTLKYLRHLKMPEETLEMVKNSFSYTWKTQRTLDENSTLNCLPRKLKMDVSMEVHMKTLGKISLFDDVLDDKESLLLELVLKLRSVIYLPGDIICRKGEIGIEMYIVKSGSVQVIGKSREDVLATLHQGSVFGEISLLGIAGANRRTADAISVGYSNLFVLSKNDLNEVIKYYPAAQKSLKRKAEALIRKTALRDRRDGPVIVIKNPEKPPETPKLMKTVIQVAPNITRTLQRHSLVPKTSEEIQRFSERCTLSKNRFHSQDGGLNPALLETVIVHHEMSMEDQL